MGFRRRVCSVFVLWPAWHVLVVGGFVVMSTFTLKTFATGTRANRATLRKAGFNSG